MARKGKLAVFGSNLKGAKSSKPKRSGQPKLVCTHYTSTPTCMNFLSQFYKFLYFDTHGLYHGSKGKIGCFWKQLKRSKIFKTKEVRPTKIGVHALHIHSYLHEFFEPILIDRIFLHPWTIAHGSKGKIGCFWKQLKRSKIFKTKEVRPTKIGVHALHIYSYLHEFFEPIL